MNTRILTSWTMRSLLLAAGIAFLCSFSVGLGGDSFKVYLGDKQLTEQYLTSKFSAPTISIREASASDVIRVHFNECGQIGAKRSLSLKAGSKVLKTWSYEDATFNSPGAWMMVKAAEVKAFQKTEANLTLNYASETIAKGVTLVTIAAQSNTASVGQ